MAAGDPGSTVLRSCLSHERGNEEQRQKRQINKGLFVVQEKFPWACVTFSGRCDTPWAGVNFWEMKGTGGKWQESEQRGLGKGRREGGRDTPEKPLCMESGFSACFWWRGVNALCMGLAGHQTFRVEGDPEAAKQDPCGLKRRGGGEGRGSSKQ